MAIINFNFIIYWHICNSLMCGFHMWIVTSHFQTSSILVSKLNRYPMSFQVYVEKLNSNTNLDKITAGANGKYLLSHLIFFNIFYPKQNQIPFYESKYQILPRDPKTQNIKKKFIRTTGCNLKKYQLNLTRVSETHSKRLIHLL